MSRREGEKSQYELLLEELAGVREGRISASQTYVDLLLAQIENLENQMTPPVEEGKNDK